jgi:hypothetical protein
MSILEKFWDLKGKSVKELWASKLPFAVFEKKKKKKKLRRQ